MSVATATSTRRCGTWTVSRRWHLHRRWCAGWTAREAPWPDDQTYGIDLRSYLHRPTTRNELIGLGGQVRNELLKDDRLDTVTVTLRVTDGARTMRVEIAARPFDPNLGDFTLTLAVTSAEIVIEEIAASG